MRKFTMVAPVLWKSRRFTGLPSDDARLAYFYLLTSPHVNGAGCYYLPVAYACEDLGWSRDQYVKALNALIEADMVAFDANAHVIVIRRWFKHNPPTNEKHLKGIENELLRLENDVLYELCMQEAEDAYYKRESQAAR